MERRNSYDENATIAVAALFPNLSEEAKAAIVWLIVDFLLSLDAMADASG